MIAIHPKELIKDALVFYKMSQKELAKRMNLAEQTITSLTKGKDRITQDTAIKLEKVFNTPSKFWNSAQSRYDEYLKRIEDEKNILERETKTFKQLKLNLLCSKLKKLGYLPKTCDTLSTIKFLQSFFRVSELSLIESVFDKQLLGMAFKSNKQVEKLDFIAWLMCGREKMRGLKVAQYDVAKFKEAISYVRKLSNQKIESVWETIVQKYASAGVFIVCTPCIGKSSVFGYTEWVEGSPVIHLSRRGSIDYSWHSLFHESYHIIQNKRSKVFVDYCGDVICDNNDIDEKNAHKFASELLLRDDDVLNEFHSHNFRNYDYGIQMTMVKQFSNSKNIIPAITVARLQRLGIIGYNTQLNSFKKK